MLERLKQLKDTLAKNNLDALLVTNLDNLYYLCGFSGSNGMLLVKQNQAVPIFYTDFRYQEQAVQEVKGCRIKIWTRNLFTNFPIADIKNIKKLGFESNHLSYNVYQTIKKQLQSKTKLIATQNLIENQRMIKDQDEINKIKKAVSITDQVFANVLKKIKPNITEKDLANEIDYQFLRMGSNAFPTIVAFASRSALPHAQPTNRRLKNNEVIIFDMGIKYQHYCADMTRTVVFGKANKKIKTIYKIVQDAQELALAGVKPNQTAQGIDRLARDYISKANCGKYFGHGLGHGIGLVVHELPTISALSNDIIKTNQVFSIEPGIYLPDEFGIRIEDLVVVTPTGCKILTQSPKELIEL